MELKRYSRTLQPCHGQMDSHYQHAKQPQFAGDVACQLQCWSPAARRALRPNYGPMDNNRPFVIHRGTNETATLLSNGNVLLYGNKFSCYAGQFFSPSTNTWARTSGQCYNNVSFGALVLLGAGKVLLAGDLITYSGQTSATVRCALYDPSTNTWTFTGSLLLAERRTATLLPKGKVLSVRRQRCGVVHAAVGFANVA